MAVNASRIGLVLAWTASGNAGFAPKGRHLRWFVPGSSGFPTKGFRVVRIDRERWSAGAPTRRVDLASVDAQPELRWSEREQSIELADGLTLVLRAPMFAKPTAQGLTFGEPTGSNMLLRFKRPAMSLALKLEFSDEPGKDDVVAFHHSTRIATMPLTKRMLIEQPGMTDVLVPVGVKAIRSLEFALEDDVAQRVVLNELGATAAEIPVPGNAAAAYAQLDDDLSEGLANRMLSATTTAAVQQRYPSAGVTRLVSAMQSTINQPHHTVTAPGEHGRADVEVAVLGHVHLAALDPNIARMLGLYWVDTKPGDCVYVIIGLHDPAFSPQTFGFAYSHADVPPAPIRGEIEAEQLPGIEYRSGAPTARVGLSWTRPSRRDRTELRPVFVDVERVVDRKGTELTAKMPHLVNSRSEICFRDETPTNLTLKYVVTPIDIFGRAGPAMESNSIKTEDQASPIPPKRVQAVVTQYGYPWQQPAQRIEPDIRSGQLVATAEFGEAQRAVSPDAATIRWLWRTGAPPDNAGSPSQWQELATAKLVEPTRGFTKWNASGPASEIELTIAAVRPIATHETEAATRRLDPAVADASDIAPGATHVGSDLVEVLIDHALLEPGVFDGFRIGPPAANMHVVGTHAGLAASADTPDLASTARLVVADSDGVLQAGKVTLNHPDTMGEPEVQSLLRTATIAGHDLGASPILRIDMDTDAPINTKAIGGEVAIDVAFRTIDGTATTPARLKPTAIDDDDPNVERRTIVARIVALIPGSNSSGSIARLIVRLSLKDYLHLRVIEIAEISIVSPLRWYEPYVLPKTTIGLNGELGDIAIAMGPTERFTSLFISATTLDSGGVESVTVAPPHEARIVNPPTTTTPARPFPVGGSAAATEPGVVSFPDRDGQSTVAVGWTPVGTPDDLVRYELGRALDTTIVATDRKRWVRGGSTAHFADHSIVAPQPISAQLVGSAERGANGRSLVVTVTPVEPGDRERLTNLQGRVSLRHESEFEPRWLRVVRTLPARESVQLVCEPFYDLAADPPEVVPDSTCSIEGSPGYSAALADDDTLRSLADVIETAADRTGEGRNDDAFGIITGTPVDGSSHIDVVPGIGRSRFFYKVRTVSPSDARSAWSPASVAFRQLDLVAPPPPEIIDITPLQNLRRVTLRRLSEPGVVGVRVRVHDPAADTITSLDYRLDANHDLALTAPPFRAAGSLVDLRPGLDGSEVKAADLVGVFDLAEVIGADGRNANRPDWSRAKNLAGRDPRVAHGIVELASPPPPGTALAVVTNHRRTDALLEINDRLEFDLGVPHPDAVLTIAALKPVERHGRIVTLVSDPVSLGVPR